MAFKQCACAAELVRHVYTTHARAAQSDIARYATHANAMRNQCTHAQRCLSQQARGHVHGMPVSARLHEWDGCAQMRVAYSLMQRQQH
eukprot:6196750-Pleurochrysis_carterae.AAC.2